MKKDHNHYCNNLTSVYFSLSSSSRFPFSRCVFIPIFIFILCALFCRLQVLKHISLYIVPRRTVHVTNKAYRLASESRFSVGFGSGLWEGSSKTLSIVSFNVAVLLQHQTTPTTRPSEDFGFGFDFPDAVFQLLVSLDLPIVGWCPAGVRITRRSLEVILERSYDRTAGVFWCSFC